MSRCCAILVLLACVISANAITTNEADASFAAYNSAFLIKSGGQAYYKASISNSALSYFWLQALEIELSEAAYDRVPNGTNRVLVSQLLNTFLSQNGGTNWNWNDYNDDLGWADIAFARGYLITNNPVFLNVARSNFTRAYNRGWDNNLGGGLWWSTAKSQKGALSNNPNIVSGCYLYDITHDASILAKCEAMYAWVRTNIYDTNTGAIYQDISSNGVLNASVNVYNLGSFIHAANHLYRITGKSTYYNDALRTANYVRSHNFILSNGSRGENSWQDQFAHGFVEFIKEHNLLSDFYPWLSFNANTAWSARRRDLNITWNKWAAQTLADDCSSLECVSAPILIQLTAGIPVPTGNVIHLLSDDTGSGSSFNVADNWSNGASPAWTNDYVVNGLDLRTPTALSNHIFAGRSLLVTNGGALRLNTTSGGTVVVGNSLSLDNGIVSAVTRPAVLMGFVNLGSGGAVFDPQGVGGFTLNAPISGPGNLIVATDNNTFGGALWLSAFNTYTGDTIINGPFTLSLTNGATLGATNSNLVFENNGDGLTIPHANYSIATYGTLNLNGTHVHVGSLIGNGGRIVNNLSGTNNTLTLNITTNAEFQGAVQDHTIGTGTISLIKRGNGTQILSGTNSYTGGTLIAAGTLQLGDALMRNGVITGAITNNATLIFANANAQTFSNPVLGTGQLIKTGPGTLMLTASHNYTGPTTINGSTLALSGNAALTNSSSIAITNNATLDVQGNLILNSRLSMTLEDHVNASGTITASGSLVVNLGSSISTGIFRLFNPPVTGFTNVILPTVPAPNTLLNRLAVDGTLRIVAPAFFVQTNLVAQTSVMNGNGFALSWPADHTGWRLQIQTNGLISTNWMDVPASTMTNQMNMPVNGESIFFRLVYP